MATESATQRVESTSNGDWQAGAVAGIIGGVAMGALMAVRMPGVLDVAIPSMYFLAGGLAGFTVHVAHAAVLGVGFAALAATQTPLSTGRSVGLGVAYGVVLWVVLAVLVMPIWLSAVGSPANPPFPNVNATSLVGHVVYGAVAGAAYPAVRERL
ncbi:histidine kinase [Halogeometricum sp. S1BR25-6]|uniref:Histidine kinase n=1 Tax=Halogeometricum salsisoli TaxID=2950536 RepID=A0ABU2G8Y9_9EURY|nr:histidine kinase [Halogeometricum sp. S1BR25-6]MDS0297282.1 histidine kinase [Halogeometricum sp. S1BR25-6]